MLNRIHFIQRGIFFLEINPSLAGNVNTDDLSCVFHDSHRRSLTFSKRYVDQFLVTGCFSLVGIRDLSAIDLYLL